MTSTKRPARGADGGTRTRTSLSEKRILSLNSEVGKSSSFSSSSSSRERILTVTQTEQRTLKFASWIRSRRGCSATRVRGGSDSRQELVVESAERQRVADCGVGRAGSPSRLVAGWQPGSRRAARRSAPTTSLQSRTRHPEFLAQVAGPQVLVNASSCIES